MTTDRDVTRIVRSWLEQGATALPDRVLDGVLDQLHTTPQRRASWPARRLRTMKTPVRIAVAVAAVIVLAVVGLKFMPTNGALGGPGPAATPTASPSPVPSPTVPPRALPAGALPAGTYYVNPFAASECPSPSVATTPPCTETTADDTIRFTFTVPDGYSAAPFDSVWLTTGHNSAPGGGGVIFERGGLLHTDPCLTAGNDGLPDIAVGSTAAEFADALAAHPLLTVSTPVDTTLGGYFGKYVDLQVPADISDCPQSYWPWEPGLYAQGPSHQWHLWILDVDGVRVIVQATDYPGTSPQHQADIRAIVDSLQITH